MYEYFNSTFIGGNSYNSFNCFWFLSKVFSSSDLSFSLFIFLSIKNIWILFQTKPKFIVHIIGVTKAFTKNFISILLINILYPLSDWLITISLNRGKSAEFKKVNNVNLIL